MQTGEARAALQKYVEKPTATTKSAAISVRR